MSLIYTDSYMEISSPRFHLQCLREERLQNLCVENQMQNKVMASLLQQAYRQILMEPSIACTKCSFVVTYPELSMSTTNQYIIVNIFFFKIKSRSTVTSYKKKKHSHIIRQSEHHHHTNNAHKQRTQHNTTPPHLGRGSKRSRRKLRRRR